MEKKSKFVGQPQIYVTNKTNNSHHIFYLILVISPDQECGSNQSSFLLEKKTMAVACFPELNFTSFHHET